jgi:hypothetical protein
VARCQPRYRKDIADALTTLTLALVREHQARALPSADRERAPALEGFFGCLYYAGLRPAEARNV